jgi:signal transduction histidine kinase
MNLRQHYRSALSERDYRYFETYSPGDQALVIEEAKDRIQEGNLSRLKDSIKSTPITRLLGIVSHVSRSQCLGRQPCKCRKLISFHVNSASSLLQELRTPLNAIVGTIDLMQDPSNSTEHGLCVQSLEQGSSNLQAIMNRLQDIAALSHDQGTINIMPFDIVAVITGVAECRQEQTERDQNGKPVILELDPTLPLSVEGDLTKVIATTASRYASMYRNSLKILLTPTNPCLDRHDRFNKS